ncbi:GTPase IMAP family member 8 isoform X4 [Danio aesculapii]|uniref:GTPase IMAP family member 8 isoform X4 n=1 Tax=Danio aesculapii TaxID=1142201 RepID=UPI0024BF3704|nr:GTPase IMAP family member 8 isoform X4 [Danio aesculapii]
MKRQTSGEADQHEQHNNMEISNVSLEMNREDDQLKTEEREDQHDQQREQSHCSQFCSQEKSEQREREPPDMSSTSPLRILLLGKSVSENSRVGNLILGRSAFDSEAPSDVVERVGGRLKHRQVTLINSPQLLHTNISDDQITQTVRECVSLSDPGPHVVLLLLQHQQCSAEDQERVEKLQDSFSERLLQHTLVLSTQEPTEPNQILQKIIQTCSNRHFSLQRSSSADHLLQAFEDIEQSNEGRHLISGDSQCSTVEKRDTQTHSEKLNVLVCGSDGSLKSSISELILQHTHRRSESVRTDVDLHGRLINVLELPALFNTGLSEEEVMRQTLRCVSLCHPGVHAFLFIISDAPLNNEGRAEMEEIQKIFSSRINKHIMILIMQNPEHQTAELNEETQAVIQSFGGRHHYFNPRTQESTLMENIEKMLDENRGGVYSTETFLEVQMEKLVKYEEMKKKMNSLETHVLSQGSRVNTDDELRIVLLGKSGVGKSETGNTILGRKSFTAETSHQPVTKETQRETCEINGRQVTVVDTPGVFDTELTEEEIQREIRHCISMILPGPHVFLLLVPLGRFTKEEETSVKIIQETLGENSLMFTMVLFTRGDSLGNKSISQCLGKPGSPLMNLIEACGHRYHVFNNNQPEERTQVSDLLEKIDNMVKANGGSFYSCKMFREMEREKQEQQMKILMDRVRETEEEVKKLEEEKERMKIMMEEEQQNQEKERKRREEELKREIRDGEKHQREMKEMKRERETFRHEMEEIGREKEKLQIQYETETDRLMKRIETERKKREKEFTEKEEKYKTLIKEKEREMKEEMKREREEMRKEKEKLQVKNETETDRLMNRVEDERQNHEKERKKREEEFNEREEQHKREMKEKEEKMKREREEWEKQRQEEKIRRDEEDDKRREKEQRDRDEFNEKLKEEKDRMKREKEDLQSKHEEKENSMKIQIEQMNGEREELMKRHEEEKERMKMMQGERQNQEKDRKRREEELMKKHEEEKEKMKMMMEEEQDNQKKDRKRREEELMRKQEEEKERMKMMMEEERQNQETEINRREEDFREREERYKRLIKEREQKEKELLEQMKLERTHKPEERLRREEEEKEEEKQESEHKRHQSPVSDQTTEPDQRIPRQERIDPA